MARIALTRVRLSAMCLRSYSQPESRVTLSSHEPQTKTLHHVLNALNMLNALKSSLYMIACRTASRC